MASDTEKELILITGGTNGIGLATVEHIASASPKYHVIIGARNLSKGEAVLKDVQAKSGIKGTVSVIQINVTDDSSIQAAAKKVEQDFGRLDILINNAGISPEREEQWPSRKIFQDVFDTNVFGPSIVTENFVPVLKKSSNPRIINVTSVMGSISSISDHSAPYSGIRVPSYRASKSALNMLTAYQYFQLKPEGFKVWAFCPGYVVTDLAEDREERIKMGVDSAETSAKGLLEIVEGQRDDHVGCFIGRNGAKYEW